MALSLGKLVLLAPCLVGALYTADGGSKLAVQPVRLVRLLNSVYGAEHLLLFGREEEPDQLMSTLLAFDQAAALESELGGGASAQPRGVFGDLGLTGKLLARTDFFEAAARQSYGPWELAQRARRAESVADAMSQHLAECGLQPQCVVLGGDAAEAQEVSAVGMRDMGAQTPAAPSSVRLTAQLATTLLCSRSGGAGSGRSGGEADGGGGGSGGGGGGGGSGSAQGEAAPLPIPLGGAADAVLLARHAAARGRALPILVSPALWAMRAMPPSRLPESIAEQDCTIEACDVP